MSKKKKKPKPKPNTWARITLDAQKASAIRKIGEALDLERQIVKSFLQSSKRELN